MNWGRGSHRTAAQAAEAPIALRQVQRTVNLWPAPFISPLTQTTQLDPSPHSPCTASRSAVSACIPPSPHPLHKQYTVSHTDCILHSPCTASRSAVSVCPPSCSASASPSAAAGQECPRLQARRQAGGQAGRQAGRQEGRKASRQAGRKAARQAGSTIQQTESAADRETRCPVSRESHLSGTGNILLGRYPVLCATPVCCHVANLHPASCRECGTCRTQGHAEH
jgi:hypothetical protein